LLTPLAIGREAVAYPDATVIDAGVDFNGSFSAAGFFELPDKFGVMIVIAGKLAPCSFDVFADMALGFSDFGKRTNRLAGDLQT
jgi:hypothetical protein